MAWIARTPTCRARGWIDDRGLGPMTTNGPSTLRVVSFGSLDGNVWGAVLDAGRAAIVFGTPDGAASAAGAESMAITDEGSGLKLAGAGFELLVCAAESPADRNRGGAPSGATPDAVGGDALCRVTGTLTAAGAQRAVQCVGTVSTSAGLGPRVGSVRGVSGWFATDRGLTLLALRPAGSDDPGSDAIAATLFEPDGWISVDDPRLSTTFHAGDRPSRTSLELWIGDGEEQYPRRAAAEAIGDGAAVSGDGLALRVTPLRCHIGDLDGAGVYVLARISRASWPGSRR
jgi:hypothetical protein